jgi:hypothetical protein
MASVLNSKHRRFAFASSAGPHARRVSPVYAQLWYLLLLLLLLVIAGCAAC